MPFTPSHVVAVLPLAKLSRYVPFSAFAIAAMVPDLPLFFPLFDYSQTHSILGLFTVCLPISLVTFVIFEALLKQPLVALLPPPFTLRAIAPSWDWRHITSRSVLILMTAIIVGAATHVFWDSFTHAGRWGVHQVPALAKNYSILGVSLAGYKLFQYGSSLLGLPILVLAFVRSLVRVESHHRIPERLRPGVRLGVGLLLVAIPMVVSAIAFHVSPTLPQAVFLSLTRSIIVMVGAIAVYTVLYRLGIFSPPLQ